MLISTASRSSHPNLRMILLFNRSGDLLLRRSLPIRWTSRRSTASLTFPSTRLDSCLWNTLRYSKPNSKHTRHKRDLSSSLRGHYIILFKERSSAHLPLPFWVEPPPPPPLPSLHHDNPFALHCLLSFFPYSLVPAADLFHRTISFPTYLLTSLMPPRPPFLCLVTAECLVVFSQVSVVCPAANPPPPVGLKTWGEMHGRMRGWGRTAQVPHDNDRWRDRAE